MIPIKDNIPTDRTPIVTIALIVINAIVYLLAVRHVQLLPDGSGLSGSLWSGPTADIGVKYGAIPFAFTHPGQHCAFAQAVSFGQLQEGVRCGAASQVSQALPTWETALTSMFMHGSLLHIAGNMLFLWIFGNNVEDSMGRVRFVVFYVLGGLAALALQIAIDPNSTAPTIGASGAIAAVLGGYILLFPRARVLTLLLIVFFFTIIELPALLVLGIWFVEQALFGAAGLANPVGDSGGVAYFAHVGGFAFGLLLIRAFAMRRKEIPPRFPVY